MLAQSDELGALPNPNSGVKVSFLDQQNKIGHGDQHAGCFFQLKKIIIKL